jgi:hypothetical protein
VKPLLICLAVVGGLVVLAMLTKAILLLAIPAAIVVLVRVFGRTPRQRRKAGY